MLQRQKAGAFGGGARRCIPWEVFEAAVKDVGKRNADGWTRTTWEREVNDIQDDITRIDVVDANGNFGGHSSV
jgi:hypothetical protein